MQFVIYFCSRFYYFWHFHLWITKLRVFSCNLSQSVSCTNSIYASGVIVNLYPTVTQHVEIRTQKKLTILKYKTKDLWFLNATYFFASKIFIWSEENFRNFRPKIFLSHQANTLISCKISIQIDIQWCHRYLFVEKFIISLLARRILAIKTEISWFLKFESPKTCLSIDSSQRFFLIFYAALSLFKTKKSFALWMAKPLRLGYNLDIY